MNRLNYGICRKTALFFFLICICPGIVKGQISKEILCQSWLISEYNQFVAEFPCDTSTFGGDPVGPTIQTGTYQGITYIHIRKLVFSPPPFFTFYYESRYYDLSGEYLGDGTFDGQGNGFGGDFEENEALLYHCAKPYPNCCSRATIEMVQGVECILPKIITTGEILYPCEYIAGTPTLPSQVGHTAEITYEPYGGSLCNSTCLQGVRVSIGCTEKQDSCNIAIKMVQGVTCILPQVISTGEILNPCEYTNGAAELPSLVGYRTNISYSLFTGSQCFSNCLDGTSVSVGCTASPNFEDILCHPCVLNAHNQDPNQFIYFSNECPNQVMITWGVFGDFTTIYLNELDCEGISNPHCDPQNSIVIFDPNNDTYPSCSTNHTNFQTYYGSLSQSTSVSSCQDYPKKEVFNLGESVRLYSHIRLNQDPLNFDLLMRLTYPNGSIREFYSYQGFDPNGNPIPSPLQGVAYGCNYLYWNITPDAAGTYYVDYILIYQDGTQNQYGSSTFTVNIPGPAIPTFTDVTPPSFNNIMAYDAQIGDTDNDGNLDIIFHKLLAKNNSAPNTTSFAISPYPSGSNVGSGSLLDIDNDGLLDYIQSYADLVDFNNDGIMSLLAGSEYENCGKSFDHPACILTDITDNSCIIDNPIGYPIPTDFNNDRVYDLALGNSIYTNIQSGFDQLRSLPFIVGGSKAFDVNNDGKTDIVYNNYPSPLLQIMLNNGNISTVGEYKGPQIHVGDINNDGHLDILNNGVYFKNGDQMAFTFINNFAGLSPDANLFKPIDYDNDGDLDLLLIRYEASPKLFRNNSTIRNNKPNRPQNLSASVTNSNVEFTWTNGGDDLTAFPTYNLYVKNLTTNDIIYFPHSDTISGSLRKLDKGNCEYNRGWKLNNLKPGSYRWKIQAIDQGYLGSEWAVGQQFTIGATVCNTEIEMVQGVTCIVPKTIGTSQVLSVCKLPVGQDLDYTLGKKYTIGLLAHNGCFSNCQEGIPVEVTCITPAISSTDDNNTNHYHIFPIPTNGLLSINNSYLIEKIDVLTLEGHNIMADIKFDVQVDITSLPPSVYILRIKEKSGKMMVIKVIKI